MSSFSAVLFVTTTKRAVRCTQGIERTAGLNCDRMTVEYTHDKRCSIFCDGRTCTDVWDFALHSPIPGHRDVNVFRLFGQRPLQTRIATLTALANAGCPRSVRTPAEEGVTVELTRYRTRTGSIHPRVFNVLVDNQLDPYHYSRKAHLSPDIGPIRLLYVSLGGAHGYVT